MNPKTLIPRREFLGASGVLTGLIAAGSPLALLAPGRAWALELKALSSSEGATLMSVARTLAPHDRLDDAAYALVIQSVDADAARDPGTLTMLREGIRRLGSSFATEPETARVHALTALEGSDFFKTMRTKTLGVLYATPMAYAYFGYEGEAFSKGGYLLRGFNDLHWLPEVPLADSGPVPGA
ncbi:MAG TPA: twin-arginine translocation signal domain-containing protein [Steroidobacteraceae bacterium]|nr:twin-arginine translocation signal domain-containing protein [Steroidobacteraceae bacterium]